MGPFHRLECSASCARCRGACERHRAGLAPLLGAHSARKTGKGRNDDDSFLGPCRLPGKGDSSTQTYQKPRLTDSGATVDSIKNQRLCGLNGFLWSDQNARSLAHFRDWPGLKRYLELPIGTPSIPPFRDRPFLFQTLSSSLMPQSEKARLVWPRIRHTEPTVK